MKAFVCRCEDVCAKDVTQAMDEGYSTIEEIKRYTGLGTGPCQGKECLSVCADMLHQKGFAPVPFTSRPPIAPTQLKLLALHPSAYRFPDDEQEEDRGDAP